MDLQGAPCVLPNKISKWTRGAEMASLHAIKHTDKNHAPIRLQVRELREEAEGGARGASVLHVNYEEHSWFRYRRSAEGCLGFEAQADSNVWRPLGYSEERKGLLSAFIQHSLEGQQVHCLLPKIITSWILENKCLAEDVPQNRPASEDTAAHITREDKEKRNGRQPRVGRIRARRHLAMLEESLSPPARTRPSRPRKCTKGKR